MKRTNTVQSHLEYRKQLKRLWWFVSFTFPLACAAFAPLANLFTILSFVEPWIIFRLEPLRSDDPSWLPFINGAALGCAITANVFLLLGFAQRVRHSITQPLTIVLWYIAAFLHVVALSLTRTAPSDAEYSQSYYYTLLACIMHAGMATLLLLSLLPSFRLPIFKDTFPAYCSHMLTLTAPQRTLMLQTLFLTLYLALGAGAFASLNHWSYLDAIYWTEYTLLTIGFGEPEFALSPVSKGILIPYLGIGIFMLGLVIGSIRTLFIEAFQERVLWGKEIVKKEREKWWRSRNKKRGGVSGLWKALKKNCLGGRGSEGPQLRVPRKWSKEEWEVMRKLKKQANMRRRYLSLLTTSTLFLVIWFGGAIVFCFTEKAQQGFTYPVSLYFTYVSLITVGFGDVVPRSNAGKPVFVLWSLAAIPSVTLLISDVQETLARWVIEGPVETVLGGWLIGNIGNEKCMHGLEDEEKRDDEHNWHDIEDGEKRDDEQHTVDAEFHGIALQDPPYRGRVRKAHKLFHEIRKILDDEEDKRYSWEEWQRWIKILGLDDDEGWELGPVSNWTWLGDDGPLLSRRESEKIWILNKCRGRLDEEMVRLLNLGEGGGGTSGRQHLLFQKPSSTAQCSVEQLARIPGV